jgi:hypothetical protein
VTVDAVIASVVAVAGTLAGALLTHWFEVKAAGRAEIAGRSARLRQDRLQAYGAFAAIANDLRRAANNRWFRRHESSDGLESFEAADEFYRVRTESWATYYRLVLVTADPELTRLAETVIKEASAITDAADHAEVCARREATSSLIEEFTRRAGRLLGAEEA